MYTFENKCMIKFFVICNQGFMFSTVHNFHLYQRSYTHTHISTTIYIKGIYFLSFGKLFFSSVFTCIYFYLCAFELLEYVKDSLS